MSTRVSVTAIKAFEYEGRHFAKGASVPMVPIDAAVFARRGLVSLTRGYQTREATVEAPAPDPEPSTRRRRTYKRRDLVAEP